MPKPHLWAKAKTKKSGFANNKGLPKNRKARKVGGANAKTRRGKWKT